jgi:hypothetical protein
MSLQPEKKNSGGKKRPQRIRMSQQKRLGVIVARKLALGLDLNERVWQKVMSAQPEEENK